MSKLYEMFREIEKQLDFYTYDRELFENFVYELNDNINTTDEVRQAIRMLEKLRYIFSEHIEDTEWRIKRTIEKKNMDITAIIQNLGFMYVYNQYFQLKTRELEDEEKRMEHWEKDYI